MYAAFLDALPLFVSLWQSGFYQLLSYSAVKPYQDAWLTVKLPEDK